MTGLATTSARGGDELVHVALFYRDPEQLRLAVHEFVGDALADGEPVLAVLPTASLELLEGELAAAAPHVDTENMTRVGRNPNRLLAMLESWLADHAGREGVRARVVSEAMWPGRSYAEATECLRHEALVNHVLARSPTSMLCPYDSEHLDAEVIAGAELTHPRLIDETGPRASLDYGDPLELARGERWPQAEPPSSVVELPFDGGLLALRHALAEEPRVRELVPERRADLVFAVNEAATNAVRHGDGSCRARVWRDGDRVVAEVLTATPIPDPLAGRRLPAPDADDGRGLWLVNELCDLVELRSDARGASLRMHVAAA